MFYMHSFFNCTALYNVIALYKLNIIIIIIKCCQDILEKDEAEPGEMMQCLIEHKHHPDMNGKCAAGVVHHQLVSYNITQTWMASVLQEWYITSW